MLSEAESLRSDGDKLVADLVPRDVAQQEFSCHRKIVRKKTKFKQKIIKNAKNTEISRSQVGINRVCYFPAKQNRVPGTRLLELSFFLTRQLWRHRNLVLDFNLLGPLHGGQFSFRPSVK